MRPASRTVDVMLVIVPPLNVTSPYPIETTPPICSQPSRTRRRLRPKPPPPPPTHIGPNTHRCPPARTAASVPDIATPSNSAAPLSMAITPPRYCARVQRAARSAKASARLPHRAQHATRRRGSRAKLLDNVACTQNHGVPNAACNREHGTHDARLSNSFNTKGNAKRAIFDAQQAASRKRDDIKTKQQPIARIAVRASRRTAA